MRAQQNSWGWKQPIPVDMSGIFGDDQRAMRLFEQLILRANNTERSVVSLKSGAKAGKKTVILQRGQVLYGRRKYAHYLAWNEFTTDRTLQKLDNTYHVVHHQRTNDYTVVTIQDYDEIVQMHHQWLTVGNKNRRNVPKTHQQVHQQANDEQPTHSAETQTRNESLHHQVHQQRTTNAPPMHTSKSDKSVKKLAASSHLSDERTSLRQAAIAEIRELLPSRSRLTQAGVLETLSKDGWRRVQSPELYLAKLREEGVGVDPDDLKMKMLSDGRVRFGKIVDGKPVFETISWDEYSRRTDV